MFNLIKVPIDSPLSYLNIGDFYEYAGQYKNGYEKGTSKIKRFYYKAFTFNGIIMEKDENSIPNPVYMELENGKIELIGFLDYNNNFYV